MTIQRRMGSLDALRMPGCQRLGSRHGGGGQKNNANLFQGFSNVPLVLDDIYVCVYIYACNLIWWAVLGFQDVMKQQEIRKNKEKKTKKLRKKKPKTATILWRFLLAIFDYKIGDFLRFWPFLCPPIKVTAISMGHF